MPEQTQTEQAIAQYRVAQNEFNILKMRLDTQPLLDQIEYFMRGARWTIEQSSEGKIPIHMRLPLILLAFIILFGEWVLVNTRYRTIP